MQKGGAKNEPVDDEKNVQLYWMNPWMIIR